MKITALYTGTIGKFAVLAVFCIVFFCKGSMLIAEPRLWAEEGKSAIEYGWRSVFMPQVGYYALIPSSTFYLSTLIAPKYIPWQSEAVSGMFWFLLLWQILRLPKKSYSALFKVCFSTSIFAVMFGQPEIFLNTITIQFFCPVMILLLYLSWDSAKSNARKFFEYALMMVCLLNSVLGCFLFPFAVFKDWKHKNFTRIGIWISAMMVHLYMTLCFSGNSSVSWMVTQNVKLSYQELTADFWGFILHRLYWLLLAALVVGIVIYIKSDKEKSELLILCLSVAALTVFLECTKQPHLSYLHSRYLVAVYTLTVSVAFLFLNKLDVYKNTGFIMIAFCAVYFNFDSLLKAEICAECPNWESQYPKLKDKTMDVEFHPMYKNNRPWSFKNNPYILDNNEQ